MSSRLIPLLEVRLLELREVGLRIVDALVIAYEEENRIVAHRILSFPRFSRMATMYTRLRKAFITQWSVSPRGSPERT